MSCAQYMNPFISSAGGYLTNPDATTACSFCSMSTADQFLASGFNIFYGHAWRNFGLMFAYIVFNVRYYLFTLVSLVQNTYRSLSCTLRIMCSVSTPEPFCLGLTENWSKLQLVCPRTSISFSWIRFHFDYHIWSSRFYSYLVHHHFYMHTIAPVLVYIASDWGGPWMLLYLYLRFYCPFINRVRKLTGCSDALL